MTNIFTSKANALKFLEKKIKNADIEKMLYFTVPYSSNSLILSSPNLGEYPSSFFAKDMSV